MLYEFYHHQTSRKPGSIHATYLLSGILSPANTLANGNHRDEDEEDAHMQSSPFVSSQVRPEEDIETPLAVTLITLVREEDLEGTIQLACYKVSLFWKYRDIKMSLPDRC